MRPLSSQDFQNLAALVPQGPQSAQLMGALNQLAQEAAVFKLPYTYNAVFATLATGGTQQSTIQIDASAPFLIISSTFRADLAGAAQTSGTYIWPNVTVSLTDTGSNRQLMDQGVPLTSIFGNGMFPYLWPEAKLMAANSGLQVQVTSQEAVSTPNLRLAFHGYKLFSLA